MRRLIPALALALAACNVQHDGGGSQASTAVVSSIVKTNSPVASSAAFGGPITAIAMQKTSCRAGSCPAFSVWFHADGKATYVGAAAAPRKGSYVGEVDFPSLRTRVESQHPADLAWHYGTADAGAARTIVVLLHHVGRQTIETSRLDESPQSLKEIVRIIDGAANSTNWALPRQQVPANKK
jgi:hypothetical protein